MKKEHKETSKNAIGNVRAPETPCGNCKKPHNGNTYCNGADFISFTPPETKENKTGCLMPCLDYNENCPTCKKINGNVTPPKTSSWRKDFLGRFSGYSAKRKKDIMDFIEILASSEYKRGRVEAQREELKRWERIIEDSN